jgi:hypothetical protein
VTERDWDNLDEYLRGLDAQLDRIEQELNRMHRRRDMRIAWAAAILIALLLLVTWRLLPR